MNSTSPWATGWFSLTATSTIGPEISAVVVQYPDILGRITDLAPIAEAAHSAGALLIGLFDDFGYARLGISCHLANEVCEMGGLRDSLSSQAGNSFTIVEGAGLPRLNVVGFNRQVDWPTLVERVEAVGKGDVKPVVE